ncbi:MAG: hypothetical protein P4L69_16455, partial [Desulfosporosinus sp.]|nr:hypothetical protein [Desulfosporosinus sp.]
MVWIWTAITSTRSFIVHRLHTVIHLIVIIIISATTRLLEIMNVIVCLLTAAQRGFGVLGFWGFG